MSETNATVRYQFHVGRSGAGARIVLKNGPPPVARAQPGSVPRIARLVALAHKFERMLKEGTVASMADLARLGRVTRARMTQVMDLLLLDPRIQEELLHLPPLDRGRDPITLRELRYVCQTPIWAEQRKRWNEIRATLPEAAQPPPAS
jgi:hypothetical protein